MPEEHKVLFLSVFKLSFNEKPDYHGIIAICNLLLKKEHKWEWMLAIEDQDKFK